MKQTTRHICSSIIVIALIAVCLTAISNLVERKDSKIKYRDFFRQSKTLDVLFLGSSHAIDSIYPMELWHDYGIASYNMGGHGNRMPTNYVVLREALNYSSPKLVVIDCFNISSDRMYSDSIEQAHLSLDAFPLTYGKVQGIHELIQDRNLEKEFLWDFVTYHNRWDSLTRNDFVPDYSVEKGAEMNVNVAAPNAVSPLSPNIKFEENTNGTAYLEKIIELCQENRIEVLLTYLPFPSSASDQAEANRVNDIAQKYDVKYINFLELDDVVNYETDCLDEASHLNPSGGRKITDYLGTYIQNNYEIEFRTCDWSSDYAKYTAYKLSLLQGENNLRNYLMLLYDKNLSYDIKINATCEVMDDPLIQKLLYNLNSEYTITSMDSNIDFSIDVFSENKLIDMAQFDNSSRIRE